MRSKIISPSAAMPRNADNDTAGTISPADAGAVSGVFERIERPHALVYSWRIEPAPMALERVHVRFVPQGDATEIVIVHERIADAATREQHRKGWEGCLDRLAQLDFRFGR